MTKVITSPDIDFGVVDEFKSSVVNSKITNTGTERVTLTNLVSSDERFVLNSFDTRIEPKMPANSTLYFGANGRIQSATGAYYTTDQGLGSIGTTDSDGKLTVNYLMPSLALTAPSAGTKYKLSESFNVTWTSSNITLVNIILESESGGYKIFEDVDASLGTLAVSILASDGFKINETVYIYIENTHQTVDDSVQVQSIATLTINSPTLTAGTEGNVTGTSNGVEVDVYYRVSSPEGAWEVFEEGVAVDEDGNWSATGTIADADTYDFIAEDTTDRDGSAQVDDVAVAGGVVALQFGSNGEDWLTDIIEDGDDLIVAGITNGTTMFGVSTGTGAFKGFLNKIDKDGNTVAGFTPRFWVSQDSGTTLSIIQSRQITVMGNYIYNIRTSTSGNIEKRSKSSGALISNAYLKVTGERRSINNDGTNIYICGQDTQDATNPATIFKITDALAITQYKNDAYRLYFDLDFNGTDLIVSQYWDNRIRRVNTSGAVQATTGIGYISDMHIHITATANRSYTFNRSADGWRVHAMSNSTLAKLFSVDMGFSNYAPACCRKQSNGNIGFVCRNESDTVTATFFSDADAYSEIAKKVITAHSGTIRLTTSHCPIISEGGYVGGSIDGKITADATHVSGHDCFIVKAR